MNTNNTFAANCNAATSKGSCLVDSLNTLKEQRAQVNTYLKSLADEGVIDQKAYGFTALFCGLQGFFDLLSVSRELVKAYSL